MPIIIRVVAQSFRVWPDSIPFSARVTGTLSPVEQWETAVYLCDARGNILDGFVSQDWTKLLPAIEHSLDVLS